MAPASLRRIAPSRREACPDVGANRVRRALRRHRRLVSVHPSEGAGAKGASADSPTRRTDAVLTALTCGWLLIIFLLGGSARGDVAALPLLRPLAVVMLAAALFAARPAFYRRNRMVLSLLAGVFALPLLQLVPLPPDVWQGLPHRALVAQIDAWSGIGNIWRPLSLTPAATWNAFWSLFVPASLLVLVLQLSRAGRIWVLWCLALRWASVFCQQASFWPS